MLVAVLVISGVALVLSACGGTGASGGGEQHQRTGADGSDTLRGTNGDDTLIGLGGNDRIFGGLRGNDNLLGGSGKDVVIGGKNMDRRLGGNKNLVGGSGNDWVAGGLGTDNVVGKGGNDYVSDGPEHDSSIDKLSGGNGTDVATPLNKPASKDIVDCGDGKDWVLVDRKDVVSPDCEKLFVGQDSLDAFYEYDPHEFWPSLPQP